MSGRHTQTDLSGRVTTTLSTKLTDLSNNNVKSDLSFNADVSGWVDTVNATLNDALLAAADAGRRSHIVESPIFINPGKLANEATSFGSKHIHHAATFKEYLISLCNPKDRFDVHTSITVTEIFPPRPVTTITPALPQNVMFRYRFSW